MGAAMPVRKNYKLTTVAVIRDKSYVNTHDGCAFPMSTLVAEISHDLQQMFEVNGIASNGTTFTFVVTRVRP